MCSNNYSDIISFTYVILYWQHAIPFDVVLRLPVSYNMLRSPSYFRSDGYQQRARVSSSCPLVGLVSASQHQQESIGSSLSTQQPESSISFLAQKKWLCVSEATFPRPLRALVFQLGNLTHPGPHPLNPHPPHTNTLCIHRRRDDPLPSRFPFHTPFVMSQAQHKRHTRARYWSNG